MESLIKLAQEKGFEPKTVTTLWSRNFYIEDDRKHIVKAFHTPLCDYLYLCELQKWLRDNYKIHIEHYIDFTEDYPYIFKLCGSGEYDDYGFADNYDTYEEGLEAKLLEALKLIS